MMTALRRAIPISRRFFRWPSAKGSMRRLPFRLFSAANGSPAGGFGPPEAFSLRNGAVMRQRDVAERNRGVPVEVAEPREEQQDDWTEVVAEGLNEHGIYLENYDPGTHRILCPHCDGGSTAEESLSVTIDGQCKLALFNCFRASCGWSGTVRSTLSDASAGDSILRLKQSPPTQPRPNFQPLDEECLEFFLSRGISLSVLERNGIQMEMKGGKKFIAFPYFVDGQIVNVKYRGVAEKEFHQVAGARKVFYGVDDVTGAEEIIIVEGEMDKLSLEMAGFQNVVSVPDGAPAKAKTGLLAANNKKFSFLDSDSLKLGKIKKIILATDNDAPGHVLAAELARRLDSWRCWRVEWPSDFASSITGPDFSPKEYSLEQIKDSKLWFRKDANEVLTKDSAEILRAYIKDAKALPVTGLHIFSDYVEEIAKSYMSSEESHAGFSTGWASLDRYYRVVPGELTIVSGVPNSGKSEWLDALAVQMAEIHNWTIAFCSMEKPIVDHAKQLIEKHIQKPFHSNVHYAEGHPRMTPDEARVGLTWISDKFYPIKSKDDKLKPVEWILHLATKAVIRYGIRGLVIDPYNELDHARPSRMSETEFVSKMLSSIKRWAQAYQVHVWLVAHPRQLKEWRGDPPSLYDISGSAHFMNKADAGIVIHRNWDTGGRDSEGDDQTEGDESLVRVMVLKMRNKSAGRVGECILKYNLVDGRYESSEKQWTKRHRKV